MIFFFPKIIPNDLVSSINIWTDNTYSWNSNRKISLIIRIKYFVNYYTNTLKQRRTNKPKLTLLLYFQYMHNKTSIYLDTEYMCIWTHTNGIVWWTENTLCCCAMKYHPHERVKPISLKCGTTIKIQTKYNTNGITSKCVYWVCVFHFTRLFSIYVTSNNRHNKKTIKI